MTFLRRLGTTAIVAILLAAYAPEAPDPRPEGQVGPEGFTATAGSFRVSAGAAVAPAGTPVTFQSSASKPEHDIASLDTVSDSITITLDDGARQPDTPIAIETDFSSAVDRRLSAGDLLVLVSEDSAVELDIPPTEWDPTTRVVSTTTTHLTDFVVRSISMQKMLTQMGAVIDRAFSRRFRSPPNVSQKSRLRTVSNTPSGP